MKTKKTNKKNKFLNERNSFILAVVLIVLIILGYAVKLAWGGYAQGLQEEQERYHEDLANNCGCLEWERIYCMEGFKLNEEQTLCLKKEGYTRVRKGCSQFDCDGEIVNWDNETKLWEPVLEFEE